jgi:hypothetical protein
MLRCAPHDSLRLLTLASIIAIAAAFFRSGPGATAAYAAPDCVFPVVPVTYEDLEDRELFLDTIDLASFNLLFPGDPNFGVPDLETGPRPSRGWMPGTVPPSLLKAVSWIESSITQTAGNVPFGSIGPALVSFDCGHGITQITTGMTEPEGELGQGSPEQALVATHYAYNIARGAWMLADKWNDAPEKRPVAGYDTNAHPSVVENWYYAVWGYNGFTGPGANKSNHPMDPLYGSWPRTSYSCGDVGDGLGHNRANYPYQELVFGCASYPPSIDGDPLWGGQPVSLPDLNRPEFAGPMSLANFIFPYMNMDIPTPQPFHLDTTTVPNPSQRNDILGNPQLNVDRTSVTVGFADGQYSDAKVEIGNNGSGLLVWYALPSDPWLVVSPQAGGSAGQSLPCNPGKPCDRTTELQISVDPSRAPPGTRTGAVRLQALGTNQQVIINVSVTTVTRLGAPGVTRN